MRSYSTTAVLAAASIAGIGLLLVGWLDYRATRNELLGLLGTQAVSLREMVAAAARSNEAAAVAARNQVTERLLDNARLLAELDRRGALDEALLDRVAGTNRLFRAAVFAPDGSMEFSSGGRGQPPPGKGFGAASLLASLLSGEVTEAVSDIHPTRWGVGARLPAGVRRDNGGAIMLTVDATEIAALEQQTSLDRLVREIASSTPDVAYIVLEAGDFRYAGGEVPDVPPAESRTDLPGAPDPAPGASAPGAPAPRLAATQLEVAGRPVIEFAGPAGVSGAGPVSLRLGLRLDGLRRTERRLLLRLATSLGAALVLSALAFGIVWMSQRYGALSRKHAQAEAALRRRDRMSAMGELASTVAHEVRNPLNAIAMSGQRLRREFLPATSHALDEADRSELEQLLGVVEGETGRINRIVQQFLDYARPARIQPRPIDLASWARDIVEAARPAAAVRGLTLLADTSPAGEATIDPDQMRQAIDNLVRNAIEATSPGGTVRVEVRSDGRGHTFAVSDTGGGIAPGHLPKIFDLYFTTKAEGTGIGLAVSQQIVAAHDGTIEVESELGRGTTMTVRLPRRIPEVALG